jgi:hypothetical protein
LVSLLASSSNASASVVLCIASKLSYARNFYDWMVSAFSTLLAKLIANFCADLQGPRLEVRPISGMCNGGHGLETPGLARGKFAGSFECGKKASS